MANSKKSLEENQSALKANRAEMKQLYALEEQINDAQFKRIELLEKENALLQKNISSQKRNKKAIEDSAKSIRGNNKFLEDTEDILGSIADKVGKSNKLYKEGEKYLEKQKSGLSSIADLTESIADPKLSKAAESATNAYKKFQQSVARVGDRAAMTGKQQEEANVAIARARLEYDESVVSLGKMGENGQMILSTLNGMADETQQFGKSVTATTKEWEKMDAILGSFSGIPAMSEFNTLLKTNIRDTIAWKAAVFALGAALGKVAYDYFGAPIKAGMQADRERQQNQIDGIAEVAKLQTDGQSIPKQIEQERLEARISAEGEIQKLQQEAAFAGAKAAIQFSAQMQSGAAQFERAAKTALFGNKIGSVGYGAAQLQLAGISADKIASGMEAASAATGRMPSARVGADMSIMAERTGTSVDNIASINEMFQRMDGASESTAMNLSEGLRNMADQANIGLGGLMREIAEASKDALSYQIKSGPALAKQVAYAQSLGVSFGDIAKAGKSMVMNYKDSIKNEMQLSAMLGKNVDLSEVRAKFASGDTEGAMKSLQAQGLDPAQMDMFAQEQLSQALGGMDLNSLQKIATKKGADVGGLKEGSAKAGNQDFLSRTQSAESALNSKQASISAQTAILDAKLSQKIADSYLESPEYASLKTKQNLAAQEAEKLATSMAKAWKESDAFKEQLAATTQLDFVSGLKETLLGGAAAVLGGIGTSLVDKFAGKAIGKVKGMFGKGAAPAGAAPAAAGGGPGASPMASAAASASESLVPGSGPMIEAAAGNVDAAEEVIKKVDTIKDKFKSFANTAKSILKEAGGIFKTFIKVIQDVGNQLITSVSNMITKVLSSVKTLGGQLADTVGSVVGKIVDKVGGVLTKAVDVVTKIGDKLASGVMKIFNTVVKGLTDASSSLPTLLGNLGKAVGAFFSGMSAGLTTFAMAMAAPTPLFGLPVGLIVVGMAMGLAKALSIAGPGIEKLTPLLLGLADSIGGTFIGVMREAGPLIEKIFNGIALVINSVGNTISNIILTISNSIAKFATMDAGALASVAWSVTELAGAVGLFGGASILGAIGSFFGGGVFSDLKDISSYANPIQTTANAVQSLANAFASLSSIDVSSLKQIPWGDMEDFASEGGKFVLASSGGGSFALSKDTTDNIKKMATNTEAMVKLNNTMAKLLKEGFFGSGETSTMKLYIDGKDVNSSMTRYKSKTENLGPKK